MTKIRRFLAIVAFLGIAAIISSSLQGQPGKKGGTTPQITPAAQVSQLAEATESRFTAPDVITYQPVNGDRYFAMQIKPALKPAADRPRDILIMMSTAATQAGPDWVASHQIAEGVVNETAKREGDRVSLWTVNSPENTRNLSKDFLLAKDKAENSLLVSALKRYRTNDYPSGDTDLKNALKQALKTFDLSKDRCSRHRPVPRRWPQHAQPDG